MYVSNLKYLENSNINEDNIHRISNPKSNTERFLFTDFDPEIHFACVWDEFSAPASIHAFKQVIGGETLSVDVKGKESKKINFRLPIIMISNSTEAELLEDCNYERGIKERLFFVHANSKPFMVHRKHLLEEK